MCFSLARSSLGRIIYMVTLFMAHIIFEVSGTTVFQFPAEYVVCLPAVRTNQPQCKRKYLNPQFLYLYFLRSDFDPEQLPQKPLS